mgnify:CR=1 FL=1
MLNGTPWPCDHDGIARPEYHGPGGDVYRRVNRRFAEAAAAQAAPGATVWVHDYQLQLVPVMLRELRPDVRIGFFNHIPFPPLEIFSQLPWRRQVVEGLLGADLIGFQRAGDASNFVRAVRRLLGATTRGSIITLTTGHGRVSRHVRAAAFPISIDASSFDALARTPAVQSRAREIRHELGDPQVVLLGVDRLDYTKGIRHRLKAYGELLAEGRLTVPECTLVQVASPSRQNVGAYQTLRDDVETTVGRINGAVGALGQTATPYMPPTYPRDELAARALAAAVSAHTAATDGV